MKKWTYLVATLFLGATVAFTSCVNNDEPEGIKEMRSAKAELLRAKVLVEQATATKIASEATINAAIAEYNKALAAVEQAKADLVKAQAEAQRATTEAEKAAAAVKLQELQAQADEASAQAEANIVKWQAQQAEYQKNLEENLRAIAALQSGFTDAEKTAINTAREYVASTSAILNEKAESLQKAQSDYLAALNDEEEYLTEGELQNDVDLAKADADMAAANVAITTEVASRAIKYTAEEWDDLVSMLNDSIAYYRELYCKDSTEVAYILQQEEFQALEQAYKAAIQAQGEYEATKGAINTELKVYEPVAEGDKLDEPTGALKAQNDTTAMYKKEAEKDVKSAEFTYYMNPSLGFFLYLTQFGIEERSEQVLAKVLAAVSEEDTNLVALDSEAGRQQAKSNYLFYNSQANPRKYSYDPFQWKYSEYSAKGAKDNEKNMYPHLNDLTSFTTDLAAFKADPNVQAWLSLLTEDAQAASDKADSVYDASVKAWEFQAQLTENAKEGEVVANLPTEEEAARFNAGVQEYNTAYGNLSAAIEKYNTDNAAYAVKAQAFIKEQFDSLYTSVLMNGFGKSAEVKEKVAKAEEEIAIAEMFTEVSDAHSLEKRFNDFSYPALVRMIMNGGVEFVGVQVLGYTKKAMRCIDDNGGYDWEDVKTEIARMQKKGESAVAIKAQIEDMLDSNRNLVNKSSHRQLTDNDRASVLTAAEVNEIVLTIQKALSIAFADEYKQLMDNLSDCAQEVYENTISKWYKRRQKPEIRQLYEALREQLAEINGDYHGSLENKCVREIRSLLPYSDRERERRIAKTAEYLSYQDRYDENLTMAEVVLRVLFYDYKSDLRSSEELEALGVRNMPLWMDYSDHMLSYYGVNTTVNADQTYDVVFGEDKYTDDFCKKLESQSRKFRRSDRDSLYIASYSDQIDKLTFNYRLHNLPVVELQNNALSSEAEAQLTEVYVKNKALVAEALVKRSLETFGRETQPRYIKADIEEQLLALCEEQFNEGRTRFDGFGAFGYKFIKNKNLAIVNDFQKIDEYVAQAVADLQAQKAVLEAEIAARVATLKPFKDANDRVIANYKAAKKATDAAKKARDNQKAAYDATWKADQQAQNLYTYYLNVAKEQYNQLTGGYETLDQVKAYWAKQLAEAQAAYEEAAKAVEMAQNVLDLFKAGESVYAYKVQAASEALATAQANYDAAYAVYEAALANLANVLAALVAAE